MKKEILINVLIGIIVALIAVSGTWYLTEQSNKSKTDAYKREIESLNNRISTLTDKTASKYTNDKYKFTLDFPNTSWKGFQVQEGTKSVFGETAVYDVFLPTNDKLFTGRIKVFSIGIFTKSQWKKGINSEGPFYESIGVSGDYTIGYFPGPDSASDVAVTKAKIHSVTDSFNAF